MKPLVHLLPTILLVGCASHLPMRNERPPQPFPPASVLIEKCKVAVRFNEDEKSVKESEYMDGTFCMGLVEGIIGTNNYLRPPIFCLPAAGIKMWEGAKILVEFGKRNPELLNLPEPEFAVIAMIKSYPCQ
jgi:Rap1a immunity proteins